MDKRARALVAVPCILVLAGCSSSGLDIQEGWQRTVTSNAEYSTSLEYNEYTGELFDPDTTAGELALPSAAEAADSVVEAALADADLQSCEDSVRIGEGDSKYFSRRLVLGQIFRNAALATLGVEPSVAYLVAVDEMAEWVKDNTIDPFRREIGSPAYEELWDERAKASNEHFAQSYPDLVSEKESIQAAELERLRERNYDASDVASAQKFVVAQCGIEVPDDYEYPSAEDLGYSFVAATPGPTP